MALALNLCLNIYPNSVHNKILIQGVVRKMVEEDLARVFKWRNHIDVRRFMYTRHKITIGEHRSWFEQILNDETRFPLIFEVDNTSIGFVNFTQHGSIPVADWGFYMAPNTPKGMGCKLGVCALDYAFNELKLHKVCGEALTFNERSIKFHFKLGFKQEGVLRNQYFDGAEHHDAVCFGLLDHEWIQKTR